MKQIFWLLLLNGVTMKMFASSSLLQAPVDQKLEAVSLRADEIKLWLTPSAKQRRNPCSGLPAVYPDLSTRHDWPVKKGLCFVCRDRQSG